MELQHINIKLLLEKPEQLDLEPLIPIFHEWIQDRVWGELLLDVADYRHVHAGPGVILIGHEGNYSVDNTGDRLGVRYNRKGALDGGNQNRLSQAAHAAVRACQRLESDPRLQGKLHFNGQELDITINDRMVASNTPASRQALTAELKPFLQQLFAGSDYALTFDENPRNLLAVHVKSAETYHVSNLLQNLSSKISN